jgi:branched-chain amino acid transport system ATP-binding protein
MTAVLNRPTRRQHRAGMPEPVLELVDVHAGYGRFKALFGVSLRIAPAQAVAVVGHNGVGKTTLARVATGLVAPTRGRVRSGGRDLTGRGAHRFVRAGVVHAPEGRSVFATLTVEENLALPFHRRFGARGVQGACRHVYEMFPRLAERRQQPAGLLSGGEQRMLTLARAMVLQPSLLVADELSLGLAPIVTDEVYATLARILQSGTALLVIEQHTHHALSLAHGAVILERGTVTFAGSCADAAALYGSFDGRAVDPTTLTEGQ